ncbi:MAG TPA: glycosyltransferase family 4 protein, partial [Gaiellaceae bacterium]|nr:glycosyltransferase family 4 protein [Gaiellaceae bacterium]
VPESGLSDLLRNALFRDPRFARALRREAERADVFHVHDLPLAGTALTVARAAGIPVVVDFHENFPAALRSYREELSRAHALAHGLVSGIGRWEAYERRVARAADAVLVVVDEARDRLVAGGAPTDRIAVVENTEDVDRFSAIPLQPVPELGEDDAFTLLYVGGFGGRHRGLATAIDAMPAVLEALPNARLVLVGDGPIKPVLERRVQELQLGERVQFLDWQPFERVPSLIAASDVTLVPHAAHPHTEATSPHKLFQYMLLGKPVVVSSCRPLARVIGETGAGVVFEAGDASSLAGAVVSLLDPDKRRAVGEAGRAAVLQKYNWAQSSRRLLEVYDALG